MLIPWRISLTEVSRLSVVLYNIHKYVAASGYYHAVDLGNSLLYQLYSSKLPSFSFGPRPGASCEFAPRL